ncbi:uncharacterized protein LOC113227060 [Hyposmocoma kahamanoa]|uniref:uncharacterized protein LOC113227060 n=1 Tax=Hyposmocoma kahamanoa TaxID=1477025 RepID=UPI000E6D9BAE|nr:uncharacterized protein LOC113227060 [Hyposmocoma kahamanoa]
MTSIRIIFVILNILVLIHIVNSDHNSRIMFITRDPKHPAFDPKIYEEALDSELCTKQIDYLSFNDTLLRMTFLEAGLRIPRGILQGNLLDLGNYRQCLGINTEIDNMVIKGKYCQINIGLSDLVSLGGANELVNVNKAGDTLTNEINLYKRLRKHVEAMYGVERKEMLRTDAVNLNALRFTLSMCLPKPCTTKEALSNLIGIKLENYWELSCRFKNDKPWAPGVYVAIVIFSLFGALGILSTTYDIWNAVIRKRDPKSLNTICLSFSVYTNSRRLITFKPVRGAIECVDGIRAITMLWIVLGHLIAYPPPLLNNLDLFRWIFSFNSIWMTSGQVSVDTFFMLSGLLIVYTTVGKLSNVKLLKKLHLFYLHRLLRMFPLLAATILLHVGVIHYIHDGPNWLTVAVVTQQCRINWWSTLLYVHNYIRPMCVPQTWYLAIDMQLHILSPLILFWVLSGKKRLAWSALTAALLVSLTASSIYVFLNNFTGTYIRPTLTREQENKYWSYYYNNTLTRCSPFFVGMCFGYLIHFWREKKIRLTRVMKCILWIFDLAVLGLAFYATEPMKNADFDNQTYDNFVNSFMRPMWAFGLGWLILACAEGYGGPINWFLSLKLWKLPSRLSYAMYLLHFPIQFVIHGAATQHAYFSVLNFMYMFCGQLVIILIISFVFTIMVDSPCAIIFKVLLGGGCRVSMAIFTLSYDAATFLRMSDRAMPASGYSNLTGPDPSTHPDSELTGPKLYHRCPVSYAIASSVYRGALRFWGSTGWLPWPTGLQACGRYDQPNSISASQLFGLHQQSEFWSAVSCSEFAQSVSHQLVEARILVTTGLNTMLIKISFVMFCTLVFIEIVNSEHDNRAVIIDWDATHPPFDPNIYEEVLDPELCARQLEYLSLNDTLLMMTFVEAGPRIPRGILQFNLLDLGNYRQCLGINKEVDDMLIDGKYCQISIGLSDLVNFGDPTELENVKKAVGPLKDDINLYERMRQNLETLNGIKSKETPRTDAVNVGDIQFRVAVCLPKPCTIKQALPNLFGTQLVNFQEQFCRFKNDKPWAPGVYVAIVVFSLIGLLAILSTSYDIWNTLIRKRDPKSLNTICQSFSVYTNSRRLITYKPVRGTLECVDGIRAISMAWIVIGHTFSTSSPVLNNADIFQWAMSLSSIWVTTAMIGVDTFFMLSGLLIVYTTVGKLSNMKLLKNLHLFYLSRLVRMLPLLATAVLLQVGVLHYIHDGPLWNVVANLTRECRINWWSSLLFVQNYILPTCLPHSWYLAIDMQLYILSPLILFWVLSGKKKLAWSALIAALLVSLTAASIYNFLNNFISSPVRPEVTQEEDWRFWRYYYYNTLTRCSPFFVGMLFGYLIHYWREKNIRLSRIVNYILWIVNLAVLWLALYATEPMKNAGFDNKVYENFVNSFMRPMWALGLGWLILACAEGYGGPINWFLSLRMWKLPSRLSYAIYLLHFPLQFVITRAASQHIYFSVANFIYIFCGQFVIFFIVGFIFTILVDSPCSTMFKVLSGGGIKKSDSEQQGEKAN